MAWVQKTASGKYQAVWRNDKGLRVTFNTDETDRELARAKATFIQAAAQFLDDHRCNVWQRMADAGFSPRYLHRIFIGRDAIPFPFFQAMLHKVGVTFLPPEKWRDRAKPDRAKRTWEYEGQHLTLYELAAIAAEGVTSETLRYRLDSAKWDVHRAVTTPRMSHSEGGALGAEASNQRRSKRQA